MDSDRETVEVNLEYPVSVEGIFSVSFNAEGFKLIFDFILNVLRKHEARLSQSSKPSGTDSSLLATLKNLENFQSHSEKLQSSLIERLSAVENLSSGFQEQANLHENFIKEILDKINQHDVEISKQGRIIEIFKQDVEEAVGKIDNVSKDVFEVKDMTNLHVNKLNDHEKRLRGLEVDIKQALNAIKSLGGEFEQIHRPEIPEPVIEQITVIDNSKLDVLSNDLKNLGKMLKDFEARVSANEENLGKNKQTAEKAEKLSQSLENELKRLENEMKRDSKNSFKDDSKTNAFNENFEFLRNSIKNFEELLNNKTNSDEFQKMLKDINLRLEENSSKILTIENNMNKKASKIELEDLAKLINGKKETKPDENYENTKIAGILRRLAAIEESLRLLVLPEGYDLIILTNQVIKQAADLKETKEKAEKN